MKELMARKGDIVLDDTNCFRWLRDRYRAFAEDNGYTTELVYLDVPLEAVQARMAENFLKASRRSIEANVFEEHVRRFKAPQPDQAATVLSNPEDISRWIELKCRRSQPLVPGIPRQEWTQDASTDDKKSQRTARSL
jgi:predicted kinase